MIELNQFYNYLHNVKSFNDIYDVTKNIDKKIKGDIFELITFYLFQLSPILNNKLIKLWLYDNIPIELKKELNLPSKDKGIDLLAIIDDEYYAIQSKFRQDNDTIISWTELSTFFGLSFGMNNKIKGGFLVTNTYDLCDEVINSKKIEPIYGEFFDECLPNNFFNNIRKIIEGEKINDYCKKIPLNYQQNCINDSILHFENNNRGYIEMACGTGKTLTSYWIDKFSKNKITLILVPSLYLLSQFYKDWVNQSYVEQIKINYILVGSDADISDDIKYKSNGLILELDPPRIKKLIDKYKKENNKLVIISTYQSSDKLFDVTDCFDFAIFDEAHKTVGQVGKQFSLMMNDKLFGEKRIEIIKRLYMTATPKIYSGKFEDDEIISMDNERYYGKQIYSYNTGQAINDKRLVDYQLLTMITENKIIENDIIKNKLVKYKNELEDEESNYIAIVLIILKKIHDGTINHLVTYHNTIKKSKKFADLLKQINNIIYQKELCVASLDGSISMGKRNKIIKEFTNNNKSIMCSARVLNEGVNIPIIDSICFVDGRNSTVDIIQCIGRSLRLYNTKTMANIIVPIIVDDLDNEIDNKVFNNIVSILRSLKSTDTGVIDYFVIKDNKHRNSSRKIIKYEQYDKLLKSKEISLENWNKNMETKVWNLVDPFEKTCNKLKNWILKNRKFPSKNSNDKEEINLYNWSNFRKLDKKNNKLDIDKINKLETIDGWIWFTDDEGDTNKELLIFISNMFTITNDKNDFIQCKELFAIYRQYITKYNKYSKIKENEFKFRMSKFLPFKQRLHVRVNGKQKEFTSSFTNIKKNINVNININNSILNNQTHIAELFNQNEINAIKEKLILMEKEKIEIEERAKHLQSLLNKTIKECEYKMKQMEEQYKCQIDSIKRETKQLYKNHIKTFIQKLDEH